MRTSGIQCHDLGVADRVDVATPADERADGYERALALVERNDFPAALLAIQEALANHDERCNVHNLAGFILKSLNVPHLVSASVLMFERSLALWPAHTVALENLGHALVLLGRSDLALARLNQGARTSIAGEPANHAPARLLVHCHDGVTTAPIIDAVARDHAAMHVDVGDAHLQLGHLELAAEAFAAAIRCDATNHHAHQKLTNTLLELRWFHSALAAAHHGLVALATTAADSTISLIAAHSVAIVALQAAGNVIPLDFGSAEFAVACQQERQRR